MGRRVLIVEDEAITAMAIAMELEQAGHTVCDRLSAGEAVLASVERCAPEVILMDISLNGRIDGIEAVRRVRQRSDVPVIFMSGFDDEALLKRAMELHPLGFLDKPITMSELVRLIEGA